MPNPRYWKILDEQGRACHGGAYQYDLPTWDERKGWIPGAWTPLITDLAPCARGYHVCRDEHLPHWLRPRIYACEVRGEIIDHGDKVVAGQIRLTCQTPWDEMSARLFAIECASDVLSLYESQYPGDPRVCDCLEVAFRFALGEATDDERAAAWDAARAAARAAAGAAAWDAAGAAAWDAAGAAAGYAARDAAWAAQRAQFLRIVGAEAA